MFNKGNVCVCVCARARVRACVCVRVRVCVCVCVSVHLYTSRASPRFSPLAVCAARRGARREHHAVRILYMVLMKYNLKQVWTFGRWSKLPAPLAPALRAEGSIPAPHKFE